MVLYVGRRRCVHEVLKDRIGGRLFACSLLASPPNNEQSIFQGTDLLGLSHIAAS